MELLVLPIWKNISILDSSFIEKDSKGNRLQLALAQSKFIPHGRTLAQKLVSHKCTNISSRYRGYFILISASWEYNLKSETLTVLVNLTKQGDSNYLIYFRAAKRKHSDSNKAFITQQLN